MFLAMITFLAGVYVGYKYPQQVQKTTDSGKKLFNDLKDKISGKSGPSQPEGPTQ
jgi:hypothetical protein